MDAVGAVGGAWADLVRKDDIALPFLDSHRVAGKRPELRGERGQLVVRSARGSASRRGCGSGLDLNADDMLRAASVAATEAVRESLALREIEQAYLRGVLVKEADGMAFMNARNTASVDPAAIIEMLVDCGLLNRNVTNRRLQFAYDPVAEHLAARTAAQAQPGAGLAPLKDRILSEPSSAIARVMAEIEGSLQREPGEPRPAAAAVPI